jgi:hypothetical protein
MSVPTQIRNQKYISLTTFRKDGTPVATPVWFAEIDGKLCVMTRSDSGKYKRIRNTSRVKVAPCTMRGKVTGPELSGSARILPEADWSRARAAIRAKYWLARVPFLWSKENSYVEIALA